MSDETDERLATEEDAESAAKALTPKMERLLRKVGPTSTLAYDLAQAAEVDNRAAASCLTALHKRGLVERSYDEDAGAWRYWR